MSLLKSLLSYAWPVPVWEGRGKYGPLKLAWEEGHLVVNSGHANQSFGSLHAVWQQCLGDERADRRQPRSILILGFGAGSLAHILRKELRINAPITGVDGDPEMLRIARTYFHVDRLPALELVQADALEFAQRHPLRHDLVLVDLCHELDLAPGVDGAPFVAALRHCTAEGGLLCLNTIDHHAESGQRSQRVGQLLRQHFNHVNVHHYQGINRVWTAT